MVKKARRSATAARKTGSSSSSGSSCSSSAGIISLILMAAGFYSLIGGFLNQMANYLVSPWNWTAALYYLVGFLLMGMGKMYKCKK